MAIYEVPLADAATRLRLTPDAVRLRLRRGKTLQGIKRGREWFVLLDDAIADATGHPTEYDRSSDATDYDRDGATGNDRSRSATGEATPPRDELVDQLQSEVVFLRQQLEALQERLREAHLLAAQRPALPAPTGAAVAAEGMGNDSPKPTENPGNDSHSSRPWWRRLWRW